MSRKMPKAETKCLIDRSLHRRGSADLNTAVMSPPVAMDLSHWGEGRMRLTRLTSLPWRIFAFIRGEMLAA